MSEGSTVGQYKPLLSGIDKRNIISIDNQALSYSYKAVVSIIEQLLDALFNLPKLERKHILLTVGHYDGRIVAVCAKIDNGIRRYANQFGRRCKK